MNFFSWKWNFCKNSVFDLNSIYGQKIESCRGVGLKWIQKYQNLKIIFVLFVQKLNYWAIEQISNINDVINSDFSVLNTKLKSHLRWDSSLNLSKTITRRQKSEFESINIFDILEKFANLIEIMQSLDNIKKTSVDDFESGAIRNPEIEILVSECETEQINEYSGTTTLFSILKNMKTTK